jgi:hypothetical protein
MPSRRLAAALALAVLAIPLMPYSAFAWHGTGHPNTLRPQRYDGTMPPEFYSNCLPWSPKLRNWVWICGPPYPPGYPALP